MMLISLEQAIVQLRRDTSDDEQSVIEQINAASEWVINYLGRERAEAIIAFDSFGEIIFDSTGHPIGVPSSIQSAVKIIVGLLDNDRYGLGQDGAMQVEDRLAKTTMPLTVQLLLDPLRRPRMA